jgi:hypothetical protein
MLVAAGAIEVVFPGMFTLVRVADALAGAADVAAYAPPTICFCLCCASFFSAAAAAATAQGRGSSAISQHQYLKMFKESILDAALDGCRGRHPPTATSSSSSTDGATAAAPHVCYDAVLTIGSPTAGQLTLEFLRRAEKEGKARLPVLVQYMVRFDGVVCYMWDSHNNNSHPLVKEGSHAVDEPHEICSKRIEGCLVLRVTCCLQQA